MIRMTFTIVLLVALVLVGLIVGTIVKNGAPLGEPPGLTVRLKTYMTTNVAETRTGHEFPELRPHGYATSVAAVLEAAETAMQELGYEDVSVDLKADTVSAVAVTPMLGFRDTLRVAATQAGDQVVVNIRSQSQVGKGDFGANSAHVAEIYLALERTLPGN